MKLSVYLDHSPLKNGHAHRGVGVYTKNLLAELEKISDVELVESAGDAKVIHYPFFDLFRPTLPIVPPQDTVVTIHDVIPLLFSQAYKPGIKGRLFFWRQRFALKFVKAVITDSEASKRDIAKYLHVPAEKISVVYLAPNPDLQALSSEKIAKLARFYKLPEKYLLYVGDINYNKNIPQLIKSLKFLPDDLHLVCAGKNFYSHPIPEWQAIELQVALSNVANRVTFLSDLGEEPNETLSALYARAQCYVQPSLAEGFGLPVVEAMFCQTPVVAAQNSSLTEVGGDVVTYVEPTAESIAEGVKNIIQLSQRERQTMVEQAQKWVAQFSWTRTAHETAMVYRQVAAQKSSV